MAEEMDSMLDMYLYENGQLLPERVLPEQGIEKTSISYILRRI